MAVLNPDGVSYVWTKLYASLWDSRLARLKMNRRLWRPEQREVLCKSWKSTWVPHSKPLINPIWREEVPLRFRQATTPSGKRSNHVRMRKEVPEYYSAKILEVISIAADPLSQPKECCWKSLHASFTSFLLKPTTSACFFANRCLVLLSYILRQVWIYQGLRSDHILVGGVRWIARHCRPHQSVITWLVFEPKHIITWLPAMMLQLSGEFQVSSSFRKYRHVVPNHKPRR